MDAYGLMCSPLKVNRSKVSGHATKVQLHAFLTSALERSEWSTSTSNRFASRKETRQSANKRLNGHQRRAARLEKKNHLILWDSKPGPYTSLPSHYTDYATS